MRTRVLVVDDEPDLLELIHYNLTKAGYDVACVLSGEEALAHVRSSPPDLIVLDVLLPGLDGLEVCKVLRRNPTTAAKPCCVANSSRRMQRLPWSMTMS